MTELDLTWIFGSSSRSGTTWLLDMLARFSKVVPIDDPHLGDHLGVWRPSPLAWAQSEMVRGAMPDLTTLPNLKMDHPSYFFAEEYEDAWMPALRGLINARFAAQADSYGHRSWHVVVKEPESQMAGLLWRLFPHSKIVFLLRDGRDVVDSWIDAHRRGSWWQNEGGFVLTEEGRLPMVRWQSAVWDYRTREVMSALVMVPQVQVLVVRYEDMLANAAHWLGIVADFIGIFPSDREVERVADDLAFKEVDDQDRGDGHFKRLASPGAWEHNLTPEEQRAMTQIMGETLAELGYLADHRPHAERVMSQWPTHPKSKEQP